MFSITQFKSNLKIVRPNHFFVDITLPWDIQQKAIAKGIPASSMNNTFKFRCESTEFPGRTIATIDEQANGPTVKYGYDLTYPDLNITIIASEDMIERQVFEFWMENIVTNYGFGVSGRDSGGIPSGGLVKYYNEYAGGTINVYQVNDERKQIAKCTLSYTYPIGIGPMNLAWEENDSYQRFTVTMAYRFHTLDFVQRDLSGMF
jgi:hypothetical protein